jgi:8-oxo-dGTP diphosphatase
LLDLRRKIGIGHDIVADDLFVVAVAAVIVKGDRVLAMRRSAHKEAGAGVWETCSGRVGAGEEPLDAMRREIAEETGLEVELDPRPVDVYRARRGDREMIVIVYRADWKSGEVACSSEHDAYAFWTLAETEASAMPPRLIEAVRRALGA